MFGRLKRDSYGKNTRGQVIFGILVSSFLRTVVFSAITVVMVPVESWRSAQDYAKRFRIHPGAFPCLRLSHPTISTLLKRTGTNRNLNASSHSVFGRGKMAKKDRG